MVEGLLRYGTLQVCLMNVRGMSGMHQSRRFTFDWSIQSRWIAPTQSQQPSLQASRGGTAGTGGLSGSTPRGRLCLEVA